MVVKAVGLVLSVASGMSLGKEGMKEKKNLLPVYPHFVLMFRFVWRFWASLVFCTRLLTVGPFVHIACCVGNISCRLFDKYNFNDGPPSHPITPPLILMNRQAPRGIECFLGGGRGRCICRANWRRVIFFGGGFLLFCAQDDVEGFLLCCYCGNDLEGMYT